MCEMLTLAEKEIKRMNIRHDNLSLIRDKDGVSVWRVAADHKSYVMKCFERAEYRREIENYHTLISLKIPTLAVIAYTGSSILLEDIERSVYRLGIPEDMSNPKITALLGQWYKTLHENGRLYKNLHQLYDECDCLTADKLNMLMSVTDTGDLPVWHLIGGNFDKIKSAAMRLPRTLTYNDFYYTNLAVARDETSAIMYDYNMLGKGYVYSDIRNVCSSLGNEDACTAFKAAYGKFDESEIVLDEIISTLQTLIVACERDSFPSWAQESLDFVKDGGLLVAVEKYLADNNGAQ